MNKEQAIEILKRIQEEKNHDDIKNAKQFLKNLTSDTDRDFDEDYINSIKKYIETAEEELQALDIAIESLDNEWVDVENGLPKAKGYFNLSDTVICEDSGGGLYLGFYDYFENKFISSEDSVSWLIDIVAWKYIKPRKEQV